MPKIKGLIPILIITAIILAIPAIYRNNERVEIVKNDLKIVLDSAKQICDSGCTEYPSDVVLPGYEDKAELYCLRQCNNNMEGIRNDLLDDFPVLFTNQYSYRVAQAMCILGLRCPQFEVTEFIKNYR